MQNETSEHLNPIRVALGLIVKLAALAFLLWLIFFKPDIFFVAFQNFDFLVDVVASWGSLFMVKLVLTLAFTIPSVLLYKIGNIIQGRDWDYWFGN